MTPRKRKIRKIIERRRRSDHEDEKRKGRTKEIERERKCRGYATAWKRNNANMREFRGRKDDWKKIKESEKERENDAGE